MKRAHEKPLELRELEPHELVRIEGGIETIPLPEVQMAVLRKVLKRTLIS